MTSKSAGFSAMQWMPASDGAIAHWPPASLSASKCLWAESSVPSLRCSKKQVRLRISVRNAWGSRASTSAIRLPGCREVGLVARLLDVAHQPAVVTGDARSAEQPDSLRGGHAADQRLALDIAHQR